MPDELGCGVSSSENDPRPHTRTHALTREPQAAEERRRVRGCFPMRLPPACRSASCASESEVSGRRRASRKVIGGGDAGGGEEIRRRRVPGGE